MAFETSSRTRKRSRKDPPWRWMARDAQILKANHPARRLLDRFGGAPGRRSGATRSMR